MTKQVVISAPGKHGSKLLRALHSSVPYSAAELSRRVFQTPSVLLEKLDPETAEQVAKLLSNLGASVSVQAQGTTFTQGDNTHEVMVIPQSDNSINEIAQEAMGWIGCDFETIRQLLCAPPGVLIGNLSNAAAQSFKETLDHLKASVIISDTTKATYDLFAKSRDSGLHTTVDRTLIQTGFLHARIPEPNILGPVLAQCLTHEQATLLWEKLAAQRGEIYLLNRDYATFDVFLTGLPNQLKSNCAEVLERRFGISQKAFVRIAPHLPVILRRDASLVQMEEDLECLSQAKIRAHAELGTFQFFSLSVRNLVDRKAAVKTCELLGAGIDYKPDGTGWIKGPLSRTQARWLRSELIKLGVDIEMKKLEQN